MAPRTVRTPVSKIGMINVEVDPNDYMQLERLLLGLATLLHTSNLKAWLVGEPLKHVQERAKARFASEGDSATGPWAQLADATNNIRQYYGYPPEHPINKRTGNLQEYITNTFEVRSTGDEGAQVMVPKFRGTNRELAEKLRHAQRGGPGRLFGGRRIDWPARPVIALDQEDQRVIEGMLVRYVNDGLSRSGFGGVMEALA